MLERLQAFVCALVTCSLFDLVPRTDCIGVRYDALVHDQSCTCMYLEQLKLELSKCSTGRLC